MILFMYFVAGINKLLNFKNTVSGLKNMFILKKLPNLFYQIVIVCVILAVASLAANCVLFPAPYLIIFS